MPWTKLNQMFILFLPPFWRMALSFTFLPFTFSQIVKTNQVLLPFLWCQPFLILQEVYLWPRPQMLLISNLVGHLNWCTWLPSLTWTKKHLSGLDFIWSSLRLRATFAVRKSQKRKRKEKIKQESPKTVFLCEGKILKNSKYDTWHMCTKSPACGRNSWFA